MNLFSLIFGDFNITLPQNFFSMDLAQCGAPNPMLTGLKSVKMAFVSEPTCGCFRSEIIKKVCGSDSIATRNLWSNTIVKYKLSTKFI